MIPSLPYTKDISGIQYRDFIDYKNNQSSKQLDLPSSAYWKSLDSVLTNYVRHSDHKFDYTDNKAIRKHIIVDRIRYIGKESNNLDENLTGIEDPDYLEYVNGNAFRDWVLTLKPKDVKELGISKMALWKIKNRIKTGHPLNPKTKIVKILISLYYSKT